MLRLPVPITNPLHVVSGFAVWRHAPAKLHDRPFTRVVTRQDEINAAVELLDKLFQVPRAPGNVLRGIRRSGHSETRTGARH